jgi:RNA polymerase sigma-70 factor, ECF subfamily
MDYSLLQTEELVRICAERGEAPEWAEFIRRFHPLIARVVTRTAKRLGESCPAVLDDLVQDTYLKLCADNCRLLRTFRPHHPGAVYGYLKVVAANVVHDHLKHARAAKRGAGKPCQDVDSLAEWSAQTSGRKNRDSETVEHSILMHQVDRQLTKSLPAQDLARCRLIFWLYYRDGLTASAIASLPGVRLTPKGVESMLLRLTRMVRAGLVRLGDEPDEKGLRELESF